MPELLLEPIQNRDTKGQTLSVTDPAEDIAEFLLEKGARLDLFAAAMLGKLEIVRAALEAFPEAIHTPGPHGIPLIAHARAGGQEASEVVQFLEGTLG